MNEKLGTVGRHTSLEGTGGGIGGGGGGVVGRYLLFLSGACFVNALCFIVDFCY